MKGIAFSSTQGNEYFYDDDSGLIFPGQQCRSGAAPYSGWLTMSPLGQRQPPPQAVDPQQLRRHHLDEGHGFRHLILELTQQCNLRCRYCVYSEHYPFNRGYHNAMMSPERARSGLDLFMEGHAKVRQRNPSAKPIIGFYGGEPLLNFPVLRSTVEYFQERYGQDFPEALFTLTTNGLLLNDEVGDFLTRNGFSIIVSLDGNQENHDRNRVDLAGQGSYDRVFANLSRLRERHPSFNQLAVSACYDYRTDMGQLRDFFDQHDLFVVSISQIDPNNTSYYAQFTLEDKTRWRGMYEAFQAQFLEAARRDTIAKGSFLFCYVGVTFAEFAFHPITTERRPAFLPYTSCCVPGEKLFVTCDGRVHMCERINNKFPIGDLEQGLDYQRIAQVIAQYNDQICRHCRDCPVTRFCSRCFATTAQDGDFQFVQGSCADTITTVRETLVRYVDVVERRPDLLDGITVEYHGQILEKVGYLNV